MSVYRESRFCSFFTVYTYFLLPKPRIFFHFHQGIPQALQIGKKVSVNKYFKEKYIFNIGGYKNKRANSYKKIVRTLGPHLRFEQTGPVIPPIDIK